MLSLLVGVSKTGRAMATIPFMAKKTASKKSNDLKSEKDGWAGFSERLRKLRHKMGISQTVLGEMLGVHYTHISKYESGRSNPNANTLHKLAEIFGVSSGFLMSGGTDKIAQARLEDSELLSMFQQIEKLGDEDKKVVKIILDAFLLKHKVKALAS